MSNGHHPQSPSKLDALNQCPLYESNPEGSAAAERGTRQHKYLEMLLKGGGIEPEPGFVDSLDEEDREAAGWAADWAMENTSSLRYIEEHLTVMDDEFNEMTNGTSDILDPPVNEVVTVVDYKSGQRRGYRAQLAAYGLGAMQRFGVRKAVMVILYGRFKRAETYHVTYAEALAEITRIIDKVKSSDAAPRPCDYCDWCIKAVTCPALEPATTALAHWTGPTAPATIDLSEITNPRALAELLAVCDYAEAQTEAIRKHALKQAKDGVTIPGYKLTERKGQWEIDDLQALYAASGMTPAQFMAACKVVKGEFETALIGTGQAEKKSEATKMANKLFEQFGTRKPSSQFLQKEK